MDQGQAVDVVYYDFSKAFDLVPHNKLSVKLQQAGVCDKVNLWIKQWLHNRRQKVVLNGQSSEWADVESGVPQGSVLGPILFILFINDIGDGLEGVLSIYADDTKHIYPVNSKHDASVLQSEIDLLDQWATTWDMKFNSTKCAVMHFGRNNQEHEYFLGNSTLNSTKAEKDVGVIVQENLKFDQHCKKVVNKCNQIIGQVWRSFENKEPGIMLDIYHTYILPHIDYGISVWYPHLQRDIDMLESIQRRFT